MNRKREYPKSDGWEYLTIENIKKGVSKEQIIRNLTNGMPSLYEIPFFNRQRGGVAYIIMRRRPVLSEGTQNTTI